MRDDQHEVDDEALVLERPAGQVEVLHLLVLPLIRGFGNSHLLALPQRVDAGGDDDVSLREPVSDDDAVGLVAGDGNWPQRDAAGALDRRPTRRACRSVRRELTGGATTTGLRIALSSGQRCSCRSAAAAADS